MGLRHLDLFSGIGGFALAARWAGMETVQFVEKDNFCQKVLRKHWKDVPIHDDIKTFSFTDEIDVLTGGFPCQPFSVAGKKKGVKDDRYLWPEMLRIIRECRPRFIIAENVSGIISMLDTILEDLEKEGYEWTAYLIPASEIGAPHKRERLWIVANRHSERCNNGFHFGEKEQIRDDGQRYIQEIHAQWSERFPESWTAFNAQDWLEAVTNTASERQPTTGKPEQSMRGSPDREGKASDALDDTDIFRWKKYQPPVPGVDDGFPNGLDRSRALGNAIVPQVVFPILSAIKILSHREKNNGSD